MTTKVLDRIMDGARTPEGKIIAVLLALCLSLMSWNVAALSYALGADGAVAGEEEAAEQQEALTDETVDPEAPSAEAIVDSEPDSELEAQPEPEPEAPAAVEAVTTAMPAQHFEDAAHALAVVVDAPEGALPEGAKMVVTDVAAAAVIDAVEGEVDGNVVNVVAVDISFATQDGASIEPATDISVKLTPKGAAAQEVREAVADTAQDVAVVHIADSGATETVADASDVSDASISFANDAFSVYAVVVTDVQTGDETANPEVGRVTYRFVDYEGNEISTQILAADEKLTYVAPPANAPEGATFIGWMINGEALSFAVAPSAEPNSAVTITPKYASYITFYKDEAGTVVLKRDQVEVGSDYNIDNVSASPTDAAYGFVGWSNESADEGSDRAVIEDATVVINGDVSLYPVFSKGAWVHFKSAPKGKGATFVSSKFVPAGATTKAAGDFFNTRTNNGADMALTGYEFQYWTTDTTFDDNGTPIAFAAGSEPEQYAFNDVVENGQADIELNAYWTSSANATYTVYYWKQSVKDTVGLEDDVKSYDFATMETATAAAGATIDASVVKGLPVYKGLTTDGFEDPRVDSRAVDADGTTVINVYLDRQVITLKFYNASISSDKFSNPVFKSDVTNGKLTVYKGLYGSEFKNWPKSGVWKSFKSESESVPLSYIAEFIVPDMMKGASTTEVHIYQSGTPTIIPVVFYEKTYDDDGNYLGIAELGQGGITRYTRNNVHSLVLENKFENTHDLVQARRSYVDKKGKTHDIKAVSSGNKVEALDASGWQNVAVGNGIKNMVNGTGGDTTTYVITKIEVLFEPKTYTMHFHDPFTDDELVGVSGDERATISSVGGIHYKQSVSTHKPDVANVLMSDAAQVGREGYVWDGYWYKDRALTQRVTKEEWASMTMPNGDLVLYAGFKAKYCWVQVDPAGGELQNGESTWFWKLYGDTSVVTYDATRDYIADPDGTYYYRYDNLSTPAGTVNDGDQYIEGTSWYDTYSGNRVAKYTENVSDLEGTGYVQDTETTYSKQYNAYILMGWTAYDENNNEIGAFNNGDPITQNTILRANWRGSTIYRVVFLDENGEQLSSMAYVDQASIFMPTSYKSGDDTMLVPSWKVAKTDQVVNSGESLSASMAVATVSDDESENIITLQATSAEKDDTASQNEPTETTSITYHANYGDDETVVVSDIERNVAVKAGFNGEDEISFTRTGYSFLGWSTSDDAIEPEFEQGGLIAANNLEVGEGGNHLYAVWEHNECTITFVDEDGKTVLDTQTVEYGTMPVYGGETPTKASTAQYSYAFSGWEPALVAATEDTTYTAKYANSLRSYTITFVDEDGETVLDTQTVEYGTMPVYGGETPTKASTAQYSYEFEAWSPEVETVTGNATYKATYKDTVRTYTVTWKNEDGTVLETDENVSYGTMPSYDGQTPGKTASAQYNYRHNGWDKEIVEVTGDVIYTATFDALVNKYTVQFVDEDGTVISSASYEHGTAADAITRPADPTKDATAEYTYAFNGWTPEIAEVIGDATYTAQYTATKKTYTVRFLNDDGAELSSASYEYGTAADAITKPADPSKDATDEYIYTFNGWTPEIAEVTKDATYMAQYTATKNTYTVKFVNDDGTELQSGAVEYGETPAYAGETPTKAATAEYTYTFDGWTPELAAVSGDATYTAIYTASKNSYVITFVDDDERVLQTATYEYGRSAADITPANPFKPNTAEYTYAFDGWTPEVVDVVGNATYTAQYTATKNAYTVRFLNDDGTELQSGAVEYGETPAYTGETPTKDATAQYSYTFNGWDAELVPVTGEATYRATYTSTVNSYTITFVDEDGTTVLDEQTLNYGTMPAYAGAAEPAKSSTDSETFAFNGWDPEISTVTGNQTYTARYSSSPREYTITFVDFNGASLDASIQVAYGETPVYPKADPSRAADVQYTYSFSGWKLTGSTDDEAGLLPVTGDAEYTAQYTATTNKYTVRFYDYDGTTLLDEQLVEYGTTPEYAGEEVTRDGDAQYSYTFTGWTPTVTAVTGDADYTAEYESTVNKYTITWLNDEGETIDTTTVEYGQTPVHADAAKQSTAQCDYTFDRWTPEIVPVTGEATYQASFTSVLRQYDVSFVNEDGTVLQTGKVNYGETPAYAGDEPTKRGTVQYSYAFAGWDKEIVPVDGPVTYKATYTETVNKYTIVFQDETGAVLNTQEVAYGEAPVYGGGLPTKASTAQYTYTFADAWTPAIKPVDGDATYTAQFTPTLRTYTVSFVNTHTNQVVASKVYPYGTPVDEIDIIPADPDGWSDVQNVYTFAHWQDSEDASVITVRTVEGDATYESVFTPTTRQYTITFIDEDNTVLSAMSYDYGTLAENIAVPTGLTKEGNAQYSYTFAGWDSTIVNVVGNAQYKAVYDESVNTYTVRFIDWDGTELEVDEDVPYGTMPSYDGEEPARSGDAQYSHPFTGWNQDLAAVTGDVTYQATYGNTVNSYTITWKDEDGTTLGTTTAEYGALPVYQGTPTKATDAQYTYTFAGWTPAVATVTGDAEYTATYDGDVNTYTVRWINEGSVVETDSNVPYGATPEYNGATPTKASTETTDYTFSTWSPAVESVTGDADYTATYTESERLYTVTFDANGGTDVDSQAIAYRGLIDSTLASTTRDGYQFEGWKTASGASYNFDAPVTSEFTLTAAWSKIINQPGSTDPADDFEFSFDVNDLRNAIYTGQAHEPRVIATDNGTELTGIDFTVSYRDNLDAGTATAVIEGINNYSGTVELTFQIAPRPVTITSASDSKVYNGTALEAHSIESESGLISGEEPLYSFTGSQVNVGVSDNTFGIADNGAFKKANYDIDSVYGTLTVTDGSNDPNAPADQLVDPDRVVSKSHEPGVYTLGDVVTFPVTVTNIYDATMDVVLTELPGVELSESAFQMAAGETRNDIVATYTITEADVVNGSFANQISAAFNGVDADGNPIGKEFGNDDVVNTTTPDSVVEVQKVILNPQDEYAIGDVIQYQIVVVNERDAEITNVTVTDDLDAAGEIEFTELNGGTAAGNVVTFASIAALESRTILAQYTVTEADAGNRIGNSAVASATSVPGAPSDTDSVESNPVENLYTLTVNYNYANGAVAAQTTTLRLTAGAEYAIDIPSFAGFAATASDGTIVTNTLSGTMPAQDVAVAITYTPIPVIPTPTGNAPAAAGPVAPVLAAIPAAVTALTDNAPAATVTIDDDGNPLVESIDDDENALASGLEGDGDISGNGGWALVNVIATILAAVLAIVMLVGLFGRKEDKDGNDLNRNRLLRIAGIIPAAVAIVALLLTQDFSQPMVMVDAFTVLFVIAAAISVILTIASRTSAEDGDTNGTPTPAAA